VESLVILSTLHKPYPRRLVVGEYMTGGAFECCHDKKMSQCVKVAVSLGPRLEIVVNADFILSFQYTSYATKPPGMMMALKLACEGIIPAGTFSFMTPVSLLSRDLSENQGIDRGSFILASCDGDGNCRDSSSNRSELDHKAMPINFAPKSSSIRATASALYICSPLKKG
jgi:hypothetical protein